MPQDHGSSRRRTSVRERAVAVIREVIADGVEGVLKECGAALLTVAR